MNIRRATKVFGGLFVLGAIVTVALIALLWRQHNQTVMLPQPTGPYAIGRMFYDWTDHERIDPLAPTPGTKRELTVWIWYPADHSAAQRRAEYLPAPLRKALNEGSSSLITGVLLLIRNFLTTDLAKVRAHAIEGAEMSQDRPTFPVVLMKPGRGILALHYSALAEDLASHDYIVVGSDSPYSTGVVVYSDGRVVTRSAAGAPSSTMPGPTSELAPGQPNDLTLPVLKVWVGDVHFLLDQLQELNAADSSGRFAGRLDLQSVGAFGHSFGGATALQFCRDDSRCKAGVNIDGAPFGEVVKTGLAKPFLFIFSDRPVFRDRRIDLSADTRALLDAVDGIRAGLPNKPNQLILQGSRHWNFSDRALLIEARLAKLLGVLGPINQRRALAVTRGYVRAFFDAHLKAKGDDLLDGPSATYPEVRFE